MKINFRCKNFKVRTGVLKFKIAPFVLLTFFFVLYNAPVIAQTLAQATKCSLILRDRTLDVKIEIPPSKFDQISFSLTDWAGQQNYADNIYHLSATDKNGARLAVEKTGARAWTVKNLQKPFELTYTVVSQKENFMGSKVRNHFHPTLFKNYVFLWGNSFLLFPDEKAIAALPVKLKIIPNEYANFYSNFDGKADSFDDLGEFFLAAGDYRVANKTIAGRAVQFLLEGKSWKFTDEQFVNTVSQIIEAQVRYMGFYPASEKLLVTLTEGTNNNKGGTVVKNVISVYPDPQTGLKDFETLKLISHEHFHFWNGNHLTAASDKPEGYYKWMSEGFTEYYAGLTLYREGLITETEFTAWLNELLLEYQTNPVALTTTAEILGENYWKSNDYNRLPYIKGALIALLIDLQIRQKTAGKKQLDDFMRLLMKRSSRQHYDDSQLLTILNTVTETNNRQFYDNYMLGKQPLPITEVLKNSGIVAAQKPRDVFDLGFTTESGRVERGAKVKQIAAESNAAKAVLKAGDELVSFSFTMGKPAQEAAITVQRNAETVQFRFYPRKSTSLLQIEDSAKMPK